MPAAPTCHPFPHTHGYEETATRPPMHHTILQIKHKTGHSSSHRASQTTPTVPIGSKFDSLSPHVTKSRFYKSNRKAAIARATGRPRRRRRYQSVANLILYRLMSPNQGSNIKHKDGHSWSHRAPQKLSTTRFDRKSRALSHGHSG